MGWVYTIDESVDVAVAPATAWARVSDHVATPTWVTTGLRSVALLEDGVDGPGTEGAVRGVKFAGWPLVRERIVAFEPGRFQYRVLTGMPHLADHLGTVSVTPRDGGCSVRWQVMFDFHPWHPLSWAAPVFVRGFAGVLAGGLANLRTQLEPDGEAGP